MDVQTETAFSKIPDGERSKSIGVTAFTKDVFENKKAGTPRSLSEDGVVHNVVPVREGVEALVTRHRSGSITESHFAPGDLSQQHGMYHYSATNNTVQDIRSNKASTTKLRASHAQAAGYGAFAIE